MANKKKPSEICVVRAGGQEYRIWETVEVHRSQADVIDHALLTVSEISSKPAVWSAIKLAPGDQASVELAGTVVLNGTVYLRQAAYNATSHTVQIGIASRSHPIMSHTVAANPGQYINQTLQQIGSAAFGQVGVKFEIVGSPAGADIPFPRVSEAVGETPFAFIEKLCRMRNVHMIDKGNGTIIAFRGARGQSAPLQEGRNILQARLMLRNDDNVPEVTGVSQVYQPNSGPNGAGVWAKAPGPSTFPAFPGPYKFALEDAADKATAQLRVDREVSMLDYKLIDGVITVQGWLRDEGDLWFNHVLDNVLIYSPMLIPGDRITLIIKEIVHRQSTPLGTTTDIMVCNPEGLGGPILRGVGT